MSVANGIDYKQNKIDIKKLPAAGENLNVFVQPQDTITFAQNQDEATYQLVGGDVVMHLSNGSTITFVAMGMLAFEENSVGIEFPSSALTLNDILFQVDDIKETPAESVITDDFVELNDEFSDEKPQEIEQNDNISMVLNDNPPPSELPQYQNQFEDEPLPPPDEIEENDNNTIYRPQDDNPVNVAISEITDAVQAGLKFSINLFQTQKIEDNAATPTTVDGGGGSAYGGVESTPEAQFQSEVLDYSAQTGPLLIQADNPTLFDDTGVLSRTLRINPEQPTGFGITAITIANLPNGYEIVGATSTDGSTWVVNPSTDGTVMTGFVVNKFTGAADFVLKYSPLADGTRIDAVFSFTTTFDRANLLPGQEGVQTPDITELSGTDAIQFVMNEIRYDYLPNGNDPGGAIDYIDLGGDAFVLATNANYNVITTSQGDTTVIGAVGKDTILGLQGDDTLSGARGNDTIAGGTGTNILDGEDDIDTVDYSYVASVGAVVDLAAGTGTAPSATDTLSGFENIKGSNFVDTLSGDVGVNVISGGAGNDTLDGRDGNDTLLGESGDDTLIGGFGDDLIDGGIGKDVIDFSTETSSVNVVLKTDDDGTAISNQGTDTIRNVEDVIGSDFDDTITGSESKNSLFGGDGKDIVSGGDGDDIIDGGLLADTLYGGGQNDTVHGNEGADTIFGGTGDDSLFGDDADDIISGDSGNDYIQGDAGLDIIHGGTGNDQILGGVDDDALFGDAGNDILEGEAGADTLYSGAGNDVLIGGSEIDVANYADQADKITVNLSDVGNQVTKTADGGRDTFTETSGSGATAVYDVEVIQGSNFADTMVGNNVANTFLGGGSNDVLRGGAGDDVLYGENDSDTIEGGAGDDSIDGGSGSDFVDYSNDPLNVAIGVNVDLQANTATDGYGDTDTLTEIENVQGSVYDDVIKGDTTENTLLGNDGNDTFLASGGSDSIDGGNDVDVIDFNTPEITGKVFVDLENNSATQGGVTINYTISNVENIIGTDFIDTIYGDAGDNLLQGGLSRDTLLGNDGADTLEGQDGNDLLRGGTGDDTINGGIGNDTLVGDAGNDLFIGGIGTDLVDYRLFGNGTQGINIDMRTGGTDNFNNTDTFTGDVENLYGTTRDDIVIGTDDANYIYGYEGDDSIDGGLGNDRLVGAQGDDSIFGNDGDDSIEGVTGADTLDGGIGNDTIRGGDDNDLLIGGEGDDSLFGDKQNDTLLGGLGNDSLDGGLNSDTVDYSTALEAVPGDGNGVVVNLGLVTAQVVGADQGIDTLVAIESLVGSDYNDTITGSSVRNRISTGTGDDTLINSAENDIYDGGSGIDTLDFHTGTEFKNVEVDLSLSSAQIEQDGLNGRDTIIGNSIEIIQGSALNDTLSGDANANTFFGNEGTDILSGAAGNDVLDGGSGNDRIFGGANDDALDGGADNDFLDGGSGADNLLGNTGNDQLYGGAGNDVLDGGADNDTAYYYFNDGSGRVTGGVTASLNNGGTSSGLDGDGGTDTYTDIENITGSRFNDTLQGDGNTNILNGVTGNDSLDGLGGVDTLYGGDGNDSILGGDGNDTLFGGAGSDILEGGADNDIESGDGGNDTFIAGAGNDTLDGGTHDLNGGDWVDYSLSGLPGVGISGNLTGTINDAFGDTDTLSNIEHLKGTNFDDAITGNAESNTIQTLGGDDTVVGSGGNDILDGGAHTVGDWIDYSNATGAIKVDLSISGTQQIIGGGMDIDVLTDFEHIIGSDNALGNDTLLGSSTDNTIFGKAGDDTLYGAAGDDDLYGGDDVGDAGNDTVDYTNSVAKVVVDLDTGGGVGSGSGLTEGNDTLHGIENVLGSINGSDTITGDGGANILDGLGGSDEIHGDGGNDIIYGRNDNDKLFGDDGVDTLYGGASSDTLDGGAGVDTLLGEEDDDLLLGHVDGGDSFDGGSEVDTLDYSGTNAGIDLTLNGAGISVSTRTNGANDEVLRIENVTGSTIVDTITGDTNDNVIRGNAGNDTLEGGSGVDTLFGEADDDTLVVSSAADVSTDSFDGGAGTDTLQVKNDAIYDISNANITDIEKMEFDGGIDQAVTIDESQISVAGFDEFIGGAGTQDTLIVDTTNHLDISSKIMTDVDEVIINGSGANQTLIGSTTKDIINGGAGDDELHGRAGNDTLNGQDGSDTLFGNAGDDVLDGGAGGSNVDVADYSEAAGGITVDLTQAVQVTNDGDAGQDTLIDIEVIRATSNADNLKGDANANTLDGRGGDDILEGGGGADNLIGGNENDTFIYNVSGDETGDIIDGGSGVADKIEANANIDLTTATVSGIEEVEIATAGVEVKLDDTQVSAIDTYTGSAGANDRFIVDVADGNSLDLTTKTITNMTQAGDVVEVNLLGTTGGNRVDTTTGNDVVNGNAGANTIATFSGDDVINAGAGNDVIEFTAANLNSADSVDGGLNNDTIEITDNITGGNLSDVDFTNVSSVENLLLSDDTTHTLVLGSNADASGLVNIDANSAGSSAVDLDISAMSNDVAVTTGLGSDSVTLGSGDNNISTQAGIDTITVSDANLDGNDVISGGADQDTLVISDQASLVAADLVGVNADVEVLQTGATNDTINLLGSTAFDSVIAGNGDDTVTIDSARAFLDGDNGANSGLNDTLVVQGTVDLSGSTVVNFENITGDLLSMTVQQVNDFGGNVNVGANDLTIVGNGVGGSNAAFSATNITAAKIVLTAGLDQTTTINNIKMDIDGSASDESLIMNIDATTAKAGLDIQGSSVAGDILNVALNSAEALDSTFTVDSAVETFNLQVNDSNHNIDLSSISTATNFVHSGTNTGARIVSVSNASFDVDASNLVANETLELTANTNLVNIVGGNSTSDKVILDNGTSNYGSISNIEILEINSSNDLEGKIDSAVTNINLTGTLALLASDLDGNSIVIDGGITQFDSALVNSNDYSAITLANSALLEMRVASTLDVSASLVDDLTPLTKVDLASGATLTLSASQTDDTLLVNGGNANSDLVVIAVDNSDDLSAFTHSGSGNIIYQVANSDSIDLSASIDRVILGATDSLDIEGALTLDSDQVGNITSLIGGGTFNVDTVLNSTDLSAIANLTFGGTINIADSAGADNITGSKFADNISISAGAIDNVNAGDGDDVILYSGTASADVLDGGTGNNTLELSASSDLRAISGADIDNIQTLNIEGNFTATLDKDFVDNSSITNYSGGSTNLEVVQVELGAGEDLDISSKTFTSVGSLVINSAGGNSTIVGANGVDNEINLTNGSNIVTTFNGDDTINGGTGNDTISIGTGTDVVVAGDGNDIIKVAANSIKASDNIDGGTGANILELTSGTSSLDSADLANVQNIDTLQLFNTANNTFDFSVASTMSINTLDASNLTGANKVVVDVGSQINDVLGGAGNDVFSYEIANLNASDNITGNGGNDTVILKDAGTITSVGNLTSIETVEFFNGANAITVDVNGVNLVGGTSTDSFTYADANLDTNDTIDGNTGTDTLIISDAANLSGTDLTNVSDIEILQLANAANSVDLSTSGTFETILGGTGIDTIINAGGELLVDTGAGADDITLTSNVVSLDAGIGNDRVEIFVNPTGVLDGGANTDTLDINNTVTDISGATIINFEIINASANLIMNAAQADGRTINMAGQVLTINTNGGSSTLNASSITASQIVITGLTTALAITGLVVNLDGSASSDTLNITTSTSNDISIITGSDTDTVDASSIDATHTLTLSGTVDTVVTLNNGLLNATGSGDYTVTLNGSSTSISGGSGLDTLNLEAGSSLTGALSNIETINQKTTLNLTSVDLSDVVSLNVDDGTAGSITSTLTMAQYESITSANISVGTADVIALTEVNGNITAKDLSKASSATLDGNTIVNVSQANQFANNIIKAGNALDLIDTQVNIEAADFTAMDATGIETVDSSDDVLNLSIAQATTGINFVLSDLVSVGGTGADLVTAIGTYASNVDILDASNNVASLSVSQATILLGQGTSFDSGDVVTVADTQGAIEGATFADLISVGVDIVDSDNDILNLSITQATTSIDFVSGDLVTITGAGAALVTAIGSYSSNVDILDADDNIASLSIFQASTLLAESTAFASGDVVTIVDTQAAIEGAIFADLITVGVDIVDSDNDILNITTVQATTSIDFTGADTVTIVDNNAALSATNFSTLAANIDGINATDAVNINVTQADDINTYGISFDVGNNITVADLSATIEAVNFNDLVAIGVDVVDSTDTNALSLSINQATTSINFTAGDTITVVDSGANLVTAIGSYATNVDILDANDNVADISVAQASTLKTDSMSFASGDVVTVIDTDTAIQAAVFADLLAVGVDSVNSTINTLSLSMTQGTAGIDFSAGDAVTVTGTDLEISGADLSTLGANLDTLSSSDATATVTIINTLSLNTIGAVFDAANTITVADSQTNIEAANFATLFSTGIDIVDSSSGSLDLSITQATVGIDFVSSDAVGVTGLGADLVTAIGTYGNNVDVLNASDDVASLSVSQSSTLFGKGTSFDAGDVVTVADTQGAIEGATFTELIAVGVDIVNSDNDTLNLSIAQATTSIDFVSADTVTVVGTGADLVTAIGTYASNIDILNASDDVVSLNILQATTLLGQGTAFDSGDVVTIVDTQGAIEGATFADLVSVGVDIVDSSDNALDVSVVQASAGIDFVVSDSVVISDNGSNISGATFSSFGANIATINATDDSVNIDKTQVDYLLVNSINFDVSDSVTLSATGTEIAAYTFSDLVGVGVDVVDSSDGSLSVSITQASAGIDFTSTDNVTMDIGVDSNISLLSLGANIDIFDITGGSTLSTSSVQLHNQTLEINGGTTKFNGAAINNNNYINITGTSALVMLIVATTALSADNTDNISNVNSIDLNGNDFSATSNHFSGRTMSIDSSVVQTLDIIASDGATVDLSSITSANSADLTFSVAGGESAILSAISADFSSIDVAGTLTTISAIASGATITDAGTSTLIISDAGSVNALNIDVDVIEVDLAGVGTVTFTNVQTNIDASGSTATASLNVTVIASGVTVTTDASSINVISETSLADAGLITLFGDGNTTVNLVLGDVDASGQTSGNVTVNATTGSNEITTGIGDDVINAGAGADIIVAGNGTNTITGGAGADNQMGGTGNDTFVIGNAGDENGDVIDGVSGIDSLRLDASTVDLSNTSLSNIDNINLNTGGASSLTIDQSQLGGLSFNGDAGNDTLIIDNAGTLDLSALSLSSIENIDVAMSSAGNITSRDDGTTEVITGSTGNDTYSLDFSNLANVSFDGGTGLDSTVLNAGTLDLAGGDTALSLNTSNIEALDIQSMTFNNGGSGNLQISQSDIESWTDTNDDLAFTMNSTNQNGNVELLNARIAGSSDAYTNITLSSAETGNSYEFSDPNVTLALTVV